MHSLILFWNLSVGSLFNFSKLSLSVNKDNNNNIKNSNNNSNNNNTNNKKSYTNNQKKFKDLIYL